MSDDPLLADAVRYRRLMDPRYRGFLERVIARLERERRVEDGQTELVTREQLLQIMEVNPDLVFEWMERVGFKLNAGQQRKKLKLLGKYGVL